MKALFAALVPALLLLSCVEYQEDIQLDRSGAGMFTMQVAVPAAFPEASDSVLGRHDDSTGMVGLVKNLGHVQGVTIHSHSDTVIDGKRIATVCFGFDNIDALQKAGASDGDQDFVGKVRYESLGGGKWLFERTLDIRDTTSGSGDAMDMFANGMLRGILAPYVWKYSLTLPGSVLESNASQVKGGSLSWEVPLSDLMEKPFVMRAVFRLGPPVWVWVAGGSVLILLLVVVLLVVISRGNKEQPAD